MEKLFSILVELARILVAFFLMSITTNWSGNLLKSDWDTCSRYDSQNYFGADGRCEHHTSNTAKSYVKWLRWKQYLRNNGYENKCATNCNIITNNSWNDAFTNKQTQNDVDLGDCVAYMHWICTHCAFVPQLWLSHTSHSFSQGSNSERIHASICMVIHGALSLIRLFPSSTSSSCLPSSTSNCSLNFSTRKSWQTCAPFHGQKEWGHPERLHLSHRLRAQTPDLPRAQRLFKFLLLQYPVIGPGHGWHDTQRYPHNGTPEDKLIISNQKACQSVNNRRLLCFDGSGKPDGERNGR